jgi:tetratricopeptide (TPR) repeat protein
VQCFRAASDMPQAQRTLAAFVQIVKNDARSAEAWYTLGNTYRIDGKKDLAAQAYVKCIEIPNTVFANRARFHLAVEEIDHKRYVEAHEILKQILATPAPEIDRPTHEKTHFKLATLLMQMKHFGEAYIALKGCIQLYPDNANALLAREQYGECCRQLADLELKREIAERKKIALNQPDEMRLALEDNVRAFRNNRQVFLMEARKTYQALADELGVKKSRTNLDQILLRRAWFGVGECYLDDEQFLDALQVFQALQQNHRATLEGFFACLRICDLAEVFQQPPKKAEQIRDLARDSVRMTLDDLHAMPADHDLFRMNGVSPRSEWLRWAQEMDRRLQTLPRKDAGASLP